MKKIVSIIIIALLPLMGANAQGKTAKQYLEKETGLSVLM